MCIRSILCAVVVITTACAVNCEEVSNCFSNVILIRVAHFSSMSSFFFSSFYRKRTEKNQSRDTSNSRVKRNRLFRVLYFLEVVLIHLSYFLTEFCFRVLIVNEPGEANREILSVCTSKMISILLYRCFLKVTFSVTLSLSAYRTFLPSFCFRVFIVNKLEESRDSFSSRVKRNRLSGICIFLQLPCRWYYPYLSVLHFSTKFLFSSFYRKRTGNSELRSLLSSRVKRNRLFYTSIVFS